MEMEQTFSKPNNFVFSIAIVGVSIIACLFLFWLIYWGPNAGEGSGFDYSILSPVNALLNLLASICLIVGFILIKIGKVNAHKQAMLSAFVFSSLFLVSYIVYHYLHGDSLFQGQGAIRYVYFFVLISHIVLSVVALPLVLFTFFFSLTGQIVIHRKIAMFSLPIWLYVSVTGVLVYVLLNSFP